MSDGEVGLAKRHDLFGGVGVLYDQVAGIAREKNILDLSMRSFSGLDHIVGTNNMIRGLMITVLAGHPCFLDRNLEVAPLRVPQHLG